MNVFRSVPMEDSPVCARDLPAGYLRYLVARSSDSHAANIEGQDYLAWFSEGDGFCFVICDGVGSSFCGNIAARYLGERLLAFITNRGAASLSQHDARGVSTETQEYLQECQPRGNQLVAEVRLPDETPALLREALEQTRREHGSEAVFACGRLNLGLGTSRLTLMWMGDTAVQVFDQQGQRIELGGRWLNSDRWSTKYGIDKRGAQLWTWVGDVQPLGIERILAFSDGLAFAAEELHSLDDAELQRVVGNQLLSATSDDVSFLDFRLKSPGPVRGPDAPAGLRMEGDTLKWEAVGSADGYQVEKAASGVFYGATRFTTPTTCWSPTELDGSPESLYRSYRVRAVAGEQAGAWSQALWLPPPSPQTPILRLVDSPAIPENCNLEWEAVEGAQYYVLFEQEGQRAEREIYLGRERLVEVNHAQAIRSRYRIEAWGPAGKSIVSDWVRHPQAVQGPESPLDRVELETIDFRPHDMAIALRLFPPQLESLSQTKVGQSYFVRWSQVDGTVLYDLQVAARRLPGRSLSFETVYSGVEHQYEASNGAPGTYVYRVRARDGSQTSDWSEEAAIQVAANTTPSTLQVDSPSISATNQAGVHSVLAAPNLHPIENRLGSYRYTIRWSPVPGAEEYELQERSPDSLGFKRCTGEVGPVTACEVRIEYASPGLHSYRVRAVDRKRMSRFSEVVTTEVADLRSPQKPSPTLHEPNLLTTLPGGISYHLDLTSAAGGSPQLPETRGSSMPTWASRPFVEAMTLTSQPGTTTDEFTLIWTGVGSQHKYYLQEANNPDFDNACGTTHWAVGVVLREKKPGIYYYRVCAFDQRGPDPSQGSNAIRVDVLLGRPRWNRATQTLLGQEVRVHLSWQRVKWARTYELVAGPTPHPSGETFIAHSPQISLKMPEGMYYFHVRAVTADRVLGPWSKAGYVVVRSSKRGKPPDFSWGILE
jgi:hypothetical protein